MATAHAWQTIRPVRRVPPASEAPHQAQSGRDGGRGLCGGIALCAKGGATGVATLAPMGVVARLYHLKARERRARMMSYSQAYQPAWREPALHARGV